jgi:hypothetical protein
MVNHDQQKSTHAYIPLTLYPMGFIPSGKASPSVSVGRVRLYLCRCHILICPLFLGPTACSFGLWLVLICSERTVLLAGGWFVLR